MSKIRVRLTDVLGRTFDTEPTSEEELAEAGETVEQLEEMITEVLSSRAGHFSIPNGDETRIFPLHAIVSVTVTTVEPF